MLYERYLTTENRPVYLSAKGWGKTFITVWDFFVWSSRVGCFGSFISSCSMGYLTKSVKKCEILFFLKRKIHFFPQLLKLYWQQKTLLAFRCNWVWCRSSFSEEKQRKRLYWRSVASECLPGVVSQWTPLCPCRHLPAFRPSSSIDIVSFSSHFQSRVFKRKQVSFFIKYN